MEELTVAQSERICQLCGVELAPRVYANGATESEKHFARRRFCGRDCSKMYYLLTTNRYWFSEDGQIGYGMVPTGEIFMFDSEDYQNIRLTNWYRHNQGRASECYVGNSKGVSIHRVILKVAEGYEVDHINLNPLDNRKCNLRMATHRQNQCNQPLQSNNTSGITGVSYKKRRGTWNARIKHYGTEIHLGAYKTFIEAVQARNEGMRWLFGEYGRYNDVPDAPPWIKEYVESKCSCFLTEMAAFA